VTDIGGRRESPGRDIVELAETVYDNILRFGKGSKNTGDCICVSSQVAEDRRSRRKISKKGMSKKTLILIQRRFSAREGRGNVPRHKIHRQFKWYEGEETQISSALWKKKARVEVASGRSPVDWGLKNGGICYRGKWIVISAW